MEELELYYNDIPYGKENAITYTQLCIKWGKNKRAVRAILQRLSYYDPKDNCVLIRSSRGKGFYRTDNIDDMLAYKRECLSKGKSIFAPVKKINRILNNR